MTKSKLNMITFVNNSIISSNSFTQFSYNNITQMKVQELLNPANERNEHLTLYSLIIKSFTLFLYIFFKITSKYNYLLLCHMKKSTTDKIIFTNHC